MLNATHTLRLIDEFLMQGGYAPNIDAETLEKEIDLVSAASELLDVLELARDRLEISNYQGEEDEALALIESTIAKAKGN